MDENTARTVLRAFEAVRPAPVAVTDRRWRWADGVVLFPDAVCPFCKVVMRSTCIWVVNERARRLEKVVKPMGGSLEVMPRHHPHVHTNGRICMSGGTNLGPADSVVTALFLAIYPGSNLLTSNHRNSIWDAWFDDYFGHTKHDEAGLSKRSRPGLRTRLKVKRVVKAGK